MPASTKYVQLFGLGMKGLMGSNEPSLKLVVDTLGFAIDVGGDDLHLGTEQPLIGDEVPAMRFRAAGAEQVLLIPVARYSPNERLPYGFYTDSGEVELGAILADEAQTLHPKSEAGSEASFAAPAGTFGIYTESLTHSSYSEDSKNVGNATLHAVRTYPLKDRAGVAIQGSYLVCFEEAANGDYQDYVFKLSNVAPAP